MFNHRKITRIFGRTCSIALIAFTGSTTPLVQAGEINHLDNTLHESGVRGYYQLPAIHGDRVVFSAEGDLWFVSTSGGSAMRLTTHEGNEAFSEFSPDGQWLAFSAEYDGNIDVFVMPATGGEPKRLTWHPGRDEVITWSPDSQAIVFRTRRESANWNWFLFDVPVDGGGATRIDIGPGALASFSPDGRWIAWNRLGGEFRSWKRYTGGTAQDVWIGDLQNQSFTKMTDWEGSDRYPMWHDGRVFYVSDLDGRMNLYSSKPDGSDRQQYTHHDEYDIRSPDMHDGRIVYMYAGGLRLFDVNTGEDRLIDITLPSDRVRSRSRYEDASETLDTYALNWEGDRLVVSSRGDMWVAPTTDGRVIELTPNTSSTRERDPDFSPDNEWIVCITDQTGEQEIALYDPTGADEPIVLTEGEQGWIFTPVWSPDGSMLAYADLTMTLYLVDVETGERTIVEQCTGDEIEDYEFSPDSLWLAYTRPDRPWGTKSDIVLYDIENKKHHTVTTPFSHDTEPMRDPDGRYLYFLSSRSFNPTIGERDFEHISTETTVICALILAQDGLSPFLPDEMYEGTDWFPEDEYDEYDMEDEEFDDDEFTDEEDFEIIIDTDGLKDRIVQFPMPARNVESLEAGYDTIYYMTAPTERMLDEVWGEEDTRAQYGLYSYSLIDQEEMLLIEGLRDYTLSGDLSTIAYRIESEILVADIEYGFDDPMMTDEGLDPSELVLRVDPAGEWEQIFNDAWRLQRDFYFADNMAGIDWELMYDRYSRLLPRISTRQELNDLIGQLIGELSTSHTYVWGGDTIEADDVGVGLLGADLEPDSTTGLYRFKRILRPERWETDTVSPLAMTHADVQEGEYLFAINHRPITTNENLFARLEDLAWEQVLLTVGMQSDQSDARDIQIETLGDEESLRYRDWCRRNREYVDQQSNGRIGYFHLPDMDADGLIRFIAGFYAQTHKDALIIDVRFNGGGYVSQMIIERLARKVWAYDFPRRGQPSTYPDQVHVGPKTVLINQFAGSDGDIFPESFKLLKLGKVIGTRTWGGVVGIRADKMFVDGGVSTQPEYAWWEPNRGWSMENTGVYPDITVDILPKDWINNKNPQLDRAIRELLKQLEEHPVQHRPDRPTPPDKSEIKPIEPPR